MRSQSIAQIFFTNDLEWYKMQRLHLGIGHTARPNDQLRENYLQYCANLYNIAKAI
jgi:hypothetical protein